MNFDIGLDFAQTGNKGRLGLITPEKQFASNATWGSTDKVHT
jgi:hypothetical protein